MKVLSVEPHRFGGERLYLSAVDGCSENGSAELDIFISNPDMIGKVATGQLFFIDIIAIDNSDSHNQRS